MRSDEKLTYYEGVSLLTMTFLYHTFNEVLPAVAGSTGNSAWIAQLLSIVCGAALIGLYLLLCHMEKKKDFIQICDSVYGGVFSKVILTVMLVYLIFYAAVSLNQAVELLQIYAYSEISALEIDLVIMVAVTISALYSIKGMGKTVSIFLPVIFFVMLFILATSYKQYDVHLLNPILGHGVKANLTSGLMLGSQFNGVFILGIFFTAFDTEKNYRKSSFMALALAGGLIFITTICYNMAIPYSCVEDLNVGVLGLAQSNYTSRFMQRMESIFIFITVISIVLLLSISFLAIKKLYCGMFSIEKRFSKAVIAPLAVLVICVTRTIGTHQFFKNLARLIIRRYGIFITLPIVLLTLLVVFLKKVGGKTAKRITAMLLLPCLLMGLFTGCIHYREPDAEIYAIIMGYDKGETEKYRITMRFMPETSGGEEQVAETEENGPHNNIPKGTIVMEAPSFTEGINLINATVPKRVSLLHIKMIVISEELAREGVEDFVAPLIRYNEIKPTMGFVVSRNSAFEFITSESSTLTDSLQMDMELILETNKESTAYYIVSLSQFLYNYKSNYGDAVAMYGAVSQTGYETDPEDMPPSKIVSESPKNFEEGFLPGELPVVGHNKMELAGMAVFSYDKMVGALTTQECEVIMLLNNAMRTGSFSIPDPYEPDKYYVSLQVRRVKPAKITTQVDEDGHVTVTVDAQLNGSIGISQNPHASYILNSQEQKYLSDYTAQHLSEQATDLMDKLQNEYKADILQLGRHVASNFRTIEEWEEFDWPSKFPDATVNISINLNL